jgi:Putative DNA-binding domain
MNAVKLKEILEHGECAWLDYKIHPGVGFFDKKHPEYVNVRSEWLIDLAALANAYTDEPKRYLVLGIRDDKTTRHTVGLQELCDDATLQEFAKSKFEPPIEFEYSTVLYEGKNIGIFEIRAAKPDALHIAREYVGGRHGKRYLAAGQLWVRRGSNNHIGMRQELTAALSPLSAFTSHAPRKPNQINEKRLLAHYQRIRNIFQWHDIPDVVAAQILRPFGVTFSDFLDPQSLLNRVTHKMLGFLSEHFDIPLEYLLMKSENPSQFRDGYRMGAVLLCHKIIQYQQVGQLKNVHFIRPVGIQFPTKPVDHPSDNPRDYVSIVLELSRGVDDVEYSSFEDYGATEWSYQKSRLGFKAVVWFMDQMRSVWFSNWSFSGTTVSLEAMKAYNGQKMHPSEMLKHHDRWHDWHPDDYANSWGLEEGRSDGELLVVLERVKQERIDKLVENLISG